MRLYEGPVAAVPKHHTMNRYGGCGGIRPQVLQVDRNESCFSLFHSRCPEACRYLTRPKELYKTQQRRRGKSLKSVVQGRFGI